MGEGRGGEGGREVGDDGVVSLIHVVILCLAVVAQLISSAYFGSISK